MANTKVRGITIELGADTSGIQSALRSVNSAISSTSKELKDVEKLLKFDPTNTELLAQKQNALQKIISETKDKMSTLNKAMEELNKQMEDGGTEEQQKQMAALQREYISCEHSLNKYENQLESMDKDIDEVNKDTKKANKSTKDYGETAEKIAKIAAAAFMAMVTAAASLATALGKCISETAEYGDEIDKMSQKMGVTAKGYQEWDFVLEHAGSSMDAMKTSMKTLATAAEEGNEAFAELGLSLEDIQNMSQEELFEATIKGLQNVDSTTRRTYLAGKLLGKGATELGALLNMSAEETEEMKNQLSELGGLMSDEAVKASADFQDALFDLKTAFNGIKNSLGAAFLKPIETAMKGVTKILAGNTEEGLEEVKKGINDFVDELNNGDTMKKITDTITSLLQVVNEVIKGFIKALPALLKEIPGMVKELLLSVVSLIKEIDWVGLIASIGEAILGVIGSIGEVILRTIFPAADAWYAHKDAMEALYEEGEKIYEQAQRLGEQRSETYSNLEAEAEILTDIKERLLEYTDEQGHVKEGYEEEMGALIMLAESQGIHIELIDGERVAIQDIITDIDDLIAKRKQEAVTAAETDLYEQAYKERRRLEGEYKTHYDSFLRNLQLSDEAYADGRYAEAQQYKYAAEEELAAAESLKDGIVEYTAQMELATYNMEKAATGNLDELATNFDEAGLDVQGYYNDISDTNSKIIQNYEKTYGVDVPKAIEDGEYETHKAITDMMDTAKAYGADISQELGWGINDGFVKGLRDTKWKVEQEATHVMTSAVNAAKKEAGIKSPSRVFMEIGENLTKGLTIGIDDGAQSAIDATTAMMKGISGAASGAIGNIGLGLLGAGAGALTANPAGNTITMNVYGAEGQDVNLLADSVMNRIQYSLGRSNAVYV